MKSLTLKAGLVSIGAIILVGCSSVKEVAGISYDQCMYPDSPSDKAPGWVCSQPVEGLEVSAVGYSKKLAAGHGMMKDVAATEARSSLASEFSTEVNTRLSRLTTDSTTEDSAQNADVIERVQSTLSTMTLTNSRIYQTKISPNGNMYVLVGLDKDNYNKNIDALVNTALEDESPVMYRKFLKDESDKTLDEVREELNNS